jgi:hypothetical protein
MPDPPVGCLVELLVDSEDVAKEAHRRRSLDPMAGPPERRLDPNPADMAQVRTWVGLDVESLIGCRL